MGNKQIIPTALGMSYEEIVFVYNFKIVKLWDLV